MKYCDKCNVCIRGSNTFCPLCQAKLHGSNDNDLYPHVTSVYKQFELFFKILISSTVSSSVVAVAVNMLMPQTGWWSPLVVFGMICLWISMFFAFKKRRNLPKNISYQVFIVSALCIVWDIITGFRGWSLDYVVPILFTAAMISLSIIAKIMHIAVSDYMVCMIIDILFSIAPIIFIMLGLVRVLIPSVICVTTSIVLLTTIIIFQGKSIRTELSKRLHI
ncbi:MAG: DUF6320 domain-containing protein [Oscillospiraceae bacterium]